MSHETIVNLIAATKTKTGLKVTCELDRSIYFMLTIGPALPTI